ncbi:MAG: quinate 5-dehydrogenase [Clostridia bacterium]|nr:quinate 5-dehydrogenase [Clostridia bacterium]
MKRVVSVSLGSQKRNHRVEAKILGERFIIERLGTDGDLDKAVHLIKELDGKVDAFGMGGIDLFIVAGEKRYMVRDAKRLKEAASVSPIVDGSGLKNTLERRVIEYLQKNKVIDFQGKKVLMVCGVDRFGMAEALEACGAIVTYGDLIFGLGLPFPIYSLKALNRAARIIAPIVSQLPFEMLYPTGKKQEISVNKFNEYYLNADIIAGDFLFIKRYLPKLLTNKIIITNTVTKEDLVLLKERGVARLITTTPEFEGRSFGTNVMEAVLVALAGGKRELTSLEYENLLDEIGFIPRILDFNQANLA